MSSSSPKEAITGPRLGKKGREVEDKGEGLGTMTTHGTLKPLKDRTKCRIRTVSYTV
jgi:hypothetical protein